MIAYKVVRKRGEKSFSAMYGNLEYIPGQPTHPIHNTGIFCFPTLDYAVSFFNKMCMDRTGEIWTCEIEKMSIDIDIEYSPWNDGITYHILPWSIDLRTDKISYTSSIIEYPETIFAKSCVLLEKVQ